MAKDKQKPQKATTPAGEEKKPQWTLPSISCWDEQSKTHKVLTLEESTIQVRDEWDRVDYTISKELFDEDKVAVKAMMKKLGYYLIDGTTFQHYTRKIKNVDS